MNLRNKNLNRLLRVSKLKKVSNSTHTVVSGDTLTGIIDQSLRTMRSSGDLEGLIYWTDFTDSNRATAVRYQLMTALINAQNGKFDAAKLYDHAGWGQGSSATRDRTIDYRNSPGPGRNPNWIFTGEVLNIPEDQFRTILTQATEDERSEEGGEGTGGGNNGGGNNGGGNNGDGTGGDGTGGEENNKYLVLCYEFGSDGSRVLHGSTVIINNNRTAAYAAIREWAATHCSGKNALIFEPGLSNSNKPVIPENNDNPYSSDPYTQFVSFCVKHDTESGVYQVIDIFTATTGRVDEAAYREFVTRCTGQLSGVILPEVGAGPEEIEGGGGTDGDDVEVEGDGDGGTGGDTGPCDGEEFVLLCLDENGSASAIHGDTFTTYGALLADADAVAFIGACTTQLAVVCADDARDFREALDRTNVSEGNSLYLCYKEVRVGDRVTWHIMDAEIIANDDAQTIQDFRASCDAAGGTVRGGNTETTESGVGNQPHKFTCICSPDGTTPPVICKDSDDNDIVQQFEVGQVPTEEQWNAFVERCRDGSNGGNPPDRAIWTDENGNERERENLGSRPNPIPTAGELGDDFEGGQPAALMNETYLRERVLDLFRINQPIRYDTSVRRTNNQGDPTSGRYSEEDSTVSANQIKNNMRYYIDKVWGAGTMRGASPCDPLPRRATDADRNVAIGRLIEAILRTGDLQGDQYPSVHPGEKAPPTRGSDGRVRQEHLSYRRFLMESSGRNYDEELMSWNEGDWSEDIFKQFLLGRLYEVITLISTQELQRLNSGPCADSPVGRQRFRNLLESTHIFALPFGGGQRQQFNDQNPLPEGWGGHENASQHRSNEEHRRRERQLNRTQKGRVGRTNQQAMDAARNDALDGTTLASRSYRLKKLSGISPVNIKVSSRSSRVYALNNILNKNSNRASALEDLLKVSKL